MQVYMCAGMHVGIHVCRYACMHVCIYACIYVCMFEGVHKINVNLSLQLVTDTHYAVPLNLNVGNRWMTAVSSKPKARYPLESISVGP